MVFGMFSAQGTTPLVRLNTRVNAAVYKVMLDDLVIPFMNSSAVDDPIFMQDNAPCHKAKTAMSFLQEERVEYLDWPAQSPDLNPIENLWHTLGVKVMDRNPTNTEDLWKSYEKNGTKLMQVFVKI